MRIDHIGYAVKNIEKSRQAFEAIGFSFETLFIDEKRNLYIQFGQKDGYRIELLAKLDMSKESPVDSYIGKIGPTPYHFCYISNKIEEEITILKGYGYRVVVPLDEAIAFGNKKVVFLYNLQIGLIEIVEE